MIDRDDEERDDVVYQVGGYSTEANAFLCAFFSLPVGLVAYCLQGWTGVLKVFGFIIAVLAIVGLLGTLIGFLWFHASKLVKLALLKNAT